MDALQCLLQLNHLRARLGVSPAGIDKQLAECLDKAISTISNAQNSSAFGEGENIVSLVKWRKPHLERKERSNEENSVLEFKKRA